MLFPTVPPTLQIDRFSIWLGPVSDHATYPSIDYVRASLPAASSSDIPGQQVAIFTRGYGHDQRGFGYVHATFVPAQTHELSITVAVGTSDDTGLNAPYARCVCDALWFGLQKQGTSRPGAGHLTVARAFVHPIDSTEWGFTQLALYLAVVLASPQDGISGEIVQARWSHLITQWKEQMSASIRGGAESK